MTVDNDGFPVVLPPAAFFPLMLPPDGGLVFTSGVEFISRVGLAVIADGSFRVLSSLMSALLLEVSVIEEGRGGGFLAFSLVMLFESEETERDIVTPPSSNGRLRDEKDLASSISTSSIAIITSSSSTVNADSPGFPALLFWSIAVCEFSPEAVFSFELSPFIVLVLSFLDLLQRKSNLWVL